MSRSTKPRVPPRWFVRRAWFAHRRLYRLTGGRVGLWRPKPNGWGALRLTTVGRRSGVERSVMVGYFEDGPNLVTMAMNGWDEGEPSWWLNLQSQPDARVELRDGARLVRGRAARRLSHLTVAPRSWSRHDVSVLLSPRTRRGTIWPWATQPPLRTTCATSRCCAAFATGSTVTTHSRWTSRRSRGA